MLKAIALSFLSCTMIASVFLARLMAVEPSAPAGDARRKRRFQARGRGTAARWLSHVHARRGNRGEALSGLPQGGDFRPGRVLDAVRAHHQRGDRDDRPGGNDLPEGRASCGQGTVDGLPVRESEHRHTGPERQRRSGGRSGCDRSEYRHARPAIRRRVGPSRAAVEELAGANKGSTSRAARCGSWATTARSWLATVSSSKCKSPCEKSPAWLRSDVSQLCHRLPRCRTLLHGGSCP